MFLPPASRMTMSGRMRAVRGGHGDLLVEVAPGAHPGQLDHPAQLHLAPAAAGLGPPQRGDQGLGLQRAAGRSSAGRSRPARRARRATASLARVRLAQLGLYPGQGLLAAARPGARPRSRRLSSSLGGGDVGRVQPALGDFQEPPRAQVQRLRGQRPGTARRAARRPARPAPAPRVRPRRPWSARLARSSAAQAWPSVGGRRPAGRGPAGSRSRAPSTRPSTSPASSEIASMSGHAGSPARQFPA